MTRIAAFIGDEAIVVASDGKAVDQNHNTVSDRAQKIFCMSPLCLILASGRVPHQSAAVFEHISTQYSDSDDWDAELIAYDIVNLFNTSNADWLDGRQQTFIVAGYNRMDSRFEPRLFAILKKPEGWAMHTNIDDMPFMVAGDRAEATHTQIKDELHSIPKDTTSLNKYALRTIKQSSVLSPKTIGGSPGLWNIFPSLDAQPKRFTPKDMLAL